MAETMLVTQALDERDLLVAKINDKIKKIKAIDTKKRNEDQTAVERMTVEDFKKGAESSYGAILFWTVSTDIRSAVNIICPLKSKKRILKAKRKPSYGFVRISSDAGTFPRKP